MPEMLNVRDLRSGYGEAQVLHGLSFEMQPGTALALLGRNGVGKTTLINTIVGLTRWRGGSIHFDGADVTKLRADERARRGIGWVPQERNIFKSLTVDENLTAIMRPGSWTLDRLYGMFPRLAERRSNMGNQLSGGEQQMLAIARALATNPSCCCSTSRSKASRPSLLTNCSPRFAASCARKKCRRSLSNKAHARSCRLPTAL